MTRFSAPAALPFLLTALLAAGARPAPAGAQATAAAPPPSAPLPHVHDRVRVRAPGVVRGRLVGTVIERTPAVLVVRPAGGSDITIRIAAIISLERSLGRSRRHGAFRGLLWGTGVGLTLALANAGFTDGGCDGGAGECTSTASGVVTWTGAGTGIGIVIGAMLGAERWDRIRIGASPGPDRGGLSIGVDLPLFLRIGPPPHPR